MASVNEKELEKGKCKAGFEYTIDNLSEQMWAKSYFCFLNKIREDYTGDYGFHESRYSKDFHQVELYTWRQSDWVPRNASSEASLFYC